MMEGSAELVGDAVGGDSTAGVSTDDRDIGLGWRAAVAGIAAIFFVAIVFQAALPASSIDESVPNARDTVRRFVPEGWAFFTKNPRDPFPRVYRLESQNRWRDATKESFARPSYFMGLDRSGRGQGPELAILMAGIPKDSWRSCERDPSVCLAGESETTLANTSHRTICGEIGFVIQNVLPWAWRNLPTVMPSKVARARVTC